MADLTSQAVHLAVRDLERDLVEAGRQYEDAERDGDAHSMAYALQAYNLKQSELERLTGSPRPSPSITTCGGLCVTSASRWAWLGR
jgi:hypothetical protein